MRPWPDPHSWVRTARKGWHADRSNADAFFCMNLRPTDFRPAPEPPTPKTLDELECAEALPREEQMERLELENRVEWGMWRQSHLSSEFFSLIPVPVREILLQYRKRRWHLLNLLARCPGADDLHTANPALCFALASNWAFHKPAVTRPMRAARSLVRKKQRAILDWLGYPATESVRKIFAKIDSQALEVGALLYLRQSLADSDRLKLLGHLPTLNADTLRLINSEWSFARIHPRVLFDAAASDEPPDTQPVYEMLRDTLRMQQQLQNVRVPNVFSSLQHLRDIHDEISAAHNARFHEAPYYMNELPVCPFPPPPFMGTDAIIPLTSERELFTEGRDMHHCVGSYACDVASGKCYIYKITAPVRATIQISRRANSWKIQQAKLACNNPVPTEIAQQIQIELLSNR